MNDVTYKTDFYTYLCMIENTPVALCAKKDFPANTLKELIDYAKANPGKVTAGGVDKTPRRTWPRFSFRNWPG